MDPLIAVLGSVDPKREHELQLRHPVIACHAAEELGMELAKQGCRILVSCPATLGGEFAEGLFVRGYVRNGFARRSSIEVYRAYRSLLPPFTEESAHPELFRYELKETEDWAITYFVALSRTDGMIILGGGQSSLIAGLVGISYKLPMLSFPYFGGKAQEIWELLRSSNDRLATLEECGFMAQPEWRSDSARRSVEILIDQIKRKSPADSAERKGY
jgi:hypothetical protein